MTKLSGFELNKQIVIKFTGLRPVEKLFEELLGGEEDNLATYNPKLMIAKIYAQYYELVTKNIEKFNIEINFLYNVEIVKFLKTMIPEFIINITSYESLDVVVGLNTKISSESSFNSNI